MKKLSEEKVIRLKKKLLDNFNPEDFHKKIEREVKRIKSELDEQVTFLQNNPSSKTIWLMNRDIETKKLMELKADHYVTLLIYETITDFYIDPNTDLDSISDRLIAKVMLHQSGRRLDNAYAILCFNLLNTYCDTFKSIINTFK